MKYYIPTATTNFNNILSTESISPFSFYASRGFGYKRLDKVAPNNLNNLILLYDKYPRFRIDIPDIESWPMVIEIDRAPSALKKAESGNVYFSEETIYLNPITSKFIFCNSNDRQTTMTNSLRSIETKLVDLYCQSFIDISKDTETFEWTPEYNGKLLDENNNTSIHQKNDIRTDRLKGFLYGYIIGANKSINDANHLNLIYKIKRYEDTLSDLINRQNGDSGRLNSQSKIFCQDLNKILYEIQSSKLVKYVTEAKPQYDNFAQFTETINNQIMEIKTFTIHVQPFTGNSVSELNSYISNLMTSIEKLFIRKRVEQIKFPSIQREKVTDIPDQDNFLTNFMDGLLNEDCLADTIASSRYDFARSAGKLFKEQLGDKWEDSDDRVYLNTLLTNLNASAKFDLNTSNDLILKSFAAFCKKGEKGNLETFYDYLISNRIGDVSIAFGLWGIVFGFAAIPKTITNEIFQSGDLEYISSVYKHIHSQIYDSNLSGELRPCELVLFKNETPPIVNDTASDDNQLPNDDYILFKNRIISSRPNWDGMWDKLVNKLVKPLKKGKANNEIPEIHKMLDNAASKSDFLQKFQELGRPLAVKYKQDFNKLYNYFSDHQQKLPDIGNHDISCPHLNRSPLPFFVTVHGII